jgi:hypothetical protein
MAKIDELEYQLRNLLEVHLLKYLPGYRTEDKISQQLAAALHDNLKKQEELILAPNLYLIVGHPATLTGWRANSSLLEKLSDALLTVGNEAGYVFLTKPTVTTTADVSMEENKIRILASFSSESVAETRGLPVDAKHVPAPEIIPSNAFLVLYGTKIIPLTQPVINIGRRLDNQVVIDDPRVSRRHAQLRVVRNRFVIFDLNSSGGTFVNGQRANQSVLYPGDVISLAGITLIFGQDLPGRKSEDKTGPGSTYSGDRPTAILHKDRDFEE